MFTLTKSQQTISKPVIFDILPRYFYLRINMFLFKYTITNKLLTNSSVKKKIKSVKSGFPTAWSNFKQ